MTDVYLPWVHMHMQCHQVSSRLMKERGSHSSCDALPYHMSSECKMDHTLAVLEELERFLSIPDKPRERKNRQKLLRNLKVSCIHTLKCPNQTYINCITSS